MTSPLFWEHFKIEILSTHNFFALASEFRSFLAFRGLRRTRFRQTSLSLTSSSSSSSVSTEILATRQKLNLDQDELKPRLSKTSTPILFSKKFQKFSNYFLLAKVLLHSVWAHFIFCDSRDLNPLLPSALLLGATTHALNAGFPLSPPVVIKC